MKFLITEMLLSDKNDSTAASLFINVFEIHIKSPRSTSKDYKTQNQEMK